MRRVQSWAGEMRAEDARPDPLPLQRRHLHRLSASSANLPPLAVLPPPISMGVPPPANIDMDVDFDAEIKPHLRTCLVSMLVPFRDASVGVLVFMMLGSGDIISVYQLAYKIYMGTLQVLPMSSACAPLLRAACRVKAALGACLRRSGEASRLLSRCCSLYACSHNEYKKYKKHHSVFGNLCVALCRYQPITW